MSVLSPFLREGPAPDPPRRVWRDWVLVALLVPTAILEAALRTDLAWRWPSLAVTLVAIPALLWRRTRPLRAIVVAFVPGLVLDTIRLAAGNRSAGLSTMVFVLIIAYALARWGSGRNGLVGLGVMLVAAVVSVIVDHTTTSELFGGFGVLLAAVSVGAAVRYRGRARAKERDETRARERERLARDLHDTVAHHVSAIVIRAQAGLATAPTDPDAATAALRVIAEEASATLAEMRMIVRELRDGTAPQTAPAPGLAELRELAVTQDSDGPSVTVTIDGDGRVPETVASTAFRLAQESITNARRHARGATRIEVRVHAGTDALELEVIDDGAAPTRPGDGFGIVGMTERAEGLGGRLDAGPRAGGGWAVSAVLPVAGGRP